MNAKVTVEMTPEEYIEYINTLKVIEAAKTAKMTVAAYEKSVKEVKAATETIAVDLAQDKTQDLDKTDNKPVNLAEPDPSQFPAAWLTAGRPGLELVKDPVDKSGIGALNLAKVLYYLKGARIVTGKEINGKKVLKLKHTGELAGWQITMTKLLFEDDLAKAKERLDSVRDYADYDLSCRQLEENK